MDLIEVMMNGSNETNNETEPFNCLAVNKLSSANITNKSHWTISEELQPAAPALAAIYALFFLLAFCWNLFIVVTYLAKYKLLKEPGNLLLFNLALADLLVSITVMMFSFVAQAGGEFVFGYTDVVRCNVCGFAGFCTMFLIFTSFHLLAALSIDRFILLAYPLRYKRLMSLWRAVIIVFAAWIIGFIIGILPFLGFGMHEFNTQFGSCLPRFTGTNIKSGLRNFFYVIFCVLEALIPIMIIMLTNVFTYRLVSKFLKKNLKRKKTFRNPEQQKSNSEEDKKHKQQQNQLVRVFGALCIANCVSWTPVIVVVLAIGATGLATAAFIPDGVYVFGWFCYLTNPVAHPIIESFFVKDLRYQVKRARKTIRRASTAIIRTTTRLRFRDSDLDRANQAIDSGASSSSKRTIRFFNKDKAKAAPVTTTSFANTEEMVLDDMTSRGSTTPTPTPTPERARREIKKMSKVGRSVTFTDTSSSDVASSEMNDIELKSVLKRHSEPGVIRLEDIGEFIHEEDESGYHDDESCYHGDTPIPVALSSNGVHVAGDDETHVVIEDPNQQLPTQNETESVIVEQHEDEDVSVVTEEPTSPEPLINSKRNSRAETLV